MTPRTTTPPITAAIYARKSTEQHGVDDDARSVAVQVASARAFATAKGWTVDERHIYSDDAISGGETRKLIQRERLLGAIRSEPPFQVLILRDASRFSRRDGPEAFAELKAIAQAGVDIWYYQDGTRFEYGTFVANVTGVMRAEFNREHCRQTAVLVTASHTRKVAAGHVVGGRVFGYDNVRVDGHVERVINEPQAAVIRRIFDLCGNGHGYDRIAKTLNAEHVPCPRPQPGRPAGWSSTSIYDLLRRTTYRGEVIWNKTRKRDADGRTAPTPRPEADWKHVDMPHLRIVSDDQWAAAHARLRRVRTKLAASTGPRPTVRRDIESKYLLSGFLRCATCGSSVSVLTRSHGRKRAAFYGCAAHHNKGATVCANAVVVPMDRFDDAVLKALAGQLRPAVIRAILKSVFKALQPDAVATTVGTLRADLKACDLKITRLTAAVESGGALAPLIAQLQTRQTERDTLIAAIAAADATGQMQRDRTAIERKVLAHVAEWSSLLTTASTVDDGRRLLRELLAGPLTLTPDPARDAYQFAGPITTGKLIEGVVGVANKLASPTGFEPVFWP